MTEEKNNVQETTEELFSDKHMSGFKDWMGKNQLDPDQFSEEQYKTILLFGAFQEFQAQVYQAVMEQQQQQLEQMQEQAANNEGGVIQPVKKDNNIITFPGTKN